MQWFDALSQKRIQQVQKNVFFNESNMPPLVRLMDFAFSLSFESKRDAVNISVPIDKKILKQSNMLSEDRGDSVQIMNRMSVARQKLLQSMAIRNAETFLRNPTAIHTIDHVYVVIHENRLFTPGCLLRGNKSLDKGCQGAIYASMNNVTRQRIVTKLINDDDDLQRELKIYRLVKFHNIIGIPRCFGVTANKELMLQFVDGKNLYAIMSDTELSSDGKVFLALRICDIIRSLHEAGVVHYDLKLENIMISQFGEVFVVDLGLALIAKETATWKQNTMQRYFSSKGTYNPPELRDLTILSSSDIRADLFKIDSWAIGVLLYEIFNKMSISNPKSITGFKSLNKPNSLKNLSTISPESVQQIIKECLQSADTRISVDNVIIKLLNIQNAEYNSNSFCNEIQRIWPNLSYLGRRTFKT
jgi:serine/threonine protein kinase